MDDANGTGDGGDLPQSISMCKVLGWRPQKSGSLAKGISIFSLRFLRLVYRSLGRHQCDAMRWHKMGWDAVHREPNATAWLRSWPRDTQTLRHKAAKAKSSAILAPLCTQYGDSTASTCASGAGAGAGAEVGAQAKVKARSELMLDWLWVHLHLFGSVWFWFGWVLCAVCSGAGAVADATATASPTASAANWTGERCTVFT